MSPLFIPVVHSGHLEVPMSVGDRNPAWPIRLGPPSYESRKPWDPEIHVFRVRNWHVQRLPRFGLWPPGETSNEPLTGPRSSFGFFSTDRSADVALTVDGRFSRRAPSPLAAQPTLHAVAPRSKVFVETIHLYTVGQFIDGSRLRATPACVDRRLFVHRRPMHAWM